MTMVILLPSLVKRVFVLLVSLSTTVTAVAMSRKDVLKDVELMSATSAPAEVVKG